MMNNSIAATRSKHWLKALNNTLRIIANAEYPGMGFDPDFHKVRHHLERLSFTRPSPLPPPNQPACDRARAWSRAKSMHVWCVSECVCACRVCTCTLAAARVVVVWWGCWGMCCDSLLLVLALLSFSPLQISCNMIMKHAFVTMMEYTQDDAQALFDDLQLRTIIAKAARGVLM